MRKRSRQFEYRPRSPYVMNMRITKYEMEAVDHFLQLANNALHSEKQGLERLAEKASRNVPDDWLVDDFAYLEEFADLSAEFAIVGLWRCVELYRKRVLLFAAGNNAAEKAYRHKEFRKIILNLFGIDESKIRCYKSVNELRCLNNSIKHSRRVNNELAQIHRWKNKQGQTLDGLEMHYQRLRPLTEKYLDDLSGRLDRAWKRKVAHNNRLQRTAHRIAARGR